MSRRDFRTITDVAVSDILLDTKNPRIRSGHDQADCVNRILRHEDQVLALAQDIAEHGLNTTPILVSPGPEPDIYVVRDGNRRLTALKLLNDPDRWSPDARLKTRFKAIAERAPGGIPTAIDVLCSGNEEAIVREILARHSGAMGGVGQLDWSAFLRTVFLVSHNLPAEYKRPGQYAFWAEDHDVVVPDDFPITTLQRFFTVPNLARLGFDLDENDELKPNLRIDILKKMVATVIHDFASSRVKVADVFSPEDAARYIAAVRAMHGIADSAPSPLPTSAPVAGPAHGGQPSPTPAPTPRGGGPASPTSPVPPSPAPTPRAPTPAQPPANRKKIFGTGAPGIAVPPTHKAATVVSELRKLSLDDTPFAAALLLRALIELSEEYYRGQNSPLTDQRILAKNVRRAATHMRDRGMLDRSEFDITDRLCGGGDQSLIEFETLQKMVHRDTHHLTKQFVNTFWDNIAPFVRNCWR